MMNYPSLNELVEKAGCRYTLVCAIANRARQLQEKPDKLNNRKPVPVAVEELHNGDIVLSTWYE
ncbi:MAG: DNA-directed RNA polymerase subunit omega [Clostridia bacterium]|nr:DNA-directed RNA polymerase subunit omega [Clostridia bacterium]